MTALLIIVILGASIVAIMIIREGWRNWVGLAKMFAILALVGFSGGLVDGNFDDAMTLALRVGAGGTIVFALGGRKHSASEGDTHPREPVDNPFAGWIILLSYAIVLEGILITVLWVGDVLGPTARSFAATVFVLTTACLIVLDVLAKRRLGR
jgi:hypothetical protein